MNAHTDAWLDAHREEMTEALQKLIAIPSVSGGESAPGAPFGVDVRAALDNVLALCARMGMRTDAGEGYMGYADAGEGAELMGILTHLDVVPAGEGWTYPAFGGEIHDDKLYGRGTMDDKGPAIASIYALAAVLASGASFKRRVRLLFGCDEERGMGCLHHYMEHGEIPALSFSPDGEYPVVNSETNILRAAYTKAYPSTVSAWAGTVVNAVPGKARALVKLPLAVVAPIAQEYSKQGVPCTCEAEGEDTAILVSGVPAHASTPELGKNAIQHLFALLTRLPLAKADAEVAAQLHRILGLDMHGETLGIDCEDASGRITLNPGLLHWDDKGVRVDLDSRYPLSAKAEDILAKMSAGFAGFVCSDTRADPGHFVPDDSELVVALTEIYARRSGKYLPPKKIKGGTYARHLPNAVAFGPEAPGAPGVAHMADEHMALTTLLESAKIYADAILALACK